MSDTLMNAMHANIASSFWNENPGGVTAAVDNLLKAEVDLVADEDESAHAELFFGVLPTGSDNSEVGAAGQAQTPSQTPVRREKGVVVKKEPLAPKSSPRPAAQATQATVKKEP